LGREYNMGEGFLTAKVAEKILRGREENFAFSESFLSALCG